MWIESNRSLRCHVTTLSRWQVSESPPPPVAKMRVIVLRETERVKSNYARSASSASRGDNEVDHAVCSKAEFQMHTALCPFPMKMASSTQLWYIRASAGRYVFRWNGLLDEGLAFVQAGVPSCADDVTLRSCTREFQMWRRRCKQIDPRWFQGRQLRFWWMLSTMSWK